MLEKISTVTGIWLRRQLYYMNLLGFKSAHWSRATNGTGSFVKKQNKKTKHFYIAESLSPSTDGAMSPLAHNVFGLAKRQRCLPANDSTLCASRSLQLPSSWHWHTDTQDLQLLFARRISPCEWRLAFLNYLKIRFWSLVLTPHRDT